MQKAFRISIDGNIPIGDIVRHLEEINWSWIERLEMERRMNGKNDRHDQEPQWIAVDWRLMFTKTHMKECFTKICCWNGIKLAGKLSFFLWSAT